MGVHCRFVSAACKDRQAAARSKADRRRHLVDFTHGCAVAGSAGGVRPLVDGLGSVRRLEQRRHARRDPASPACGVRRYGRPRSRLVVCRRHFGAGRSLCCGRRKKNSPDEASDHALGRSRGGFTTKIHVLCDGQGHPLHFHLTAGQDHDSTAVTALLEGADQAVTSSDDAPIAWPVALAGDKAYRADWIDEYLLQRGIEPVIPSKDNEDRASRPVAFDKQAYRRRSIIEQLIGWLKESRRIFSRFEKTATNFAGMIKMAFIHRYLRLICC
jgi:transposase